MQNYNLFLNLQNFGPFFLKKLQKKRGFMRIQAVCKAVMPHIPSSLFDVYLNYESIVCRMHIFGQALIKK